MATQPLAEDNQRLWNDTLSRLMHLSSATVQRNLELEARLIELETELLAWKNAHSIAINAVERETNAHNVQTAVLNRHIVEMDIHRTGQKPLILCVINGDRQWFLPSLLVQGHAGGLAAAQQLTKGIAEYLCSKELHLVPGLSFWITVYFSKASLADQLIGKNLCTSEQLEGFLTGFNQSSPRFCMIDVGHNADAVDVKIQEYVRTFSRFSQTLRVFLRGCQDGVGFSQSLDMLDNEQLLNKIVLLQATGDSSMQPLAYKLPFFKIDEVFMVPHMARTLKAAPPASTSGSSLGTALSAGSLHTSPQGSPGSWTGRRALDPSVPLHKQTPPPCNEHYLMTCPKGAAACKYAHDYTLTEEQLASLAVNAKKAPCNWLKNGMQCPFGEKCCWGHTCPNGERCFHLSKGKCWFKGAAMHISVNTNAAAASTLLS